MITPRLFAVLPEDVVSTPDGMEIHPDGDLVLSCPNFADEDGTGCVVRVSPDGRARHWFDVPPHPETGVARNMGIARAGDRYVLCDNQPWSGAPELAFKGRLLMVRPDEDGRLLEVATIATGMEHPNGVRVRGDHLYVTQSCLTRVDDPSGLLVSAVYRFHVDDRDVQVTNTLADPQVVATFVTRRPDVQYGADGLAFGPDGALYVGNFGDGEVFRIVFDDDGNVVSNTSFAADPEQLQSTDGMCFDDDGNLWVADFSANAIARITPDGVVERVAASPDSDGLQGELNQPGEPIVYDGKIVASCFDLVTGPDKVNTGHSLPATLSYLDLSEVGGR